MRNVCVFLFTFLRVRSASACVISSSRCSERAAQKWPTGREIREHKNPRWRASPSAQKLLSSSLMIRLIIHAAHLRVTWHNMWNDECSSSSTVSAMAGIKKKKRQTNEDRENPQIGTAVWRGIIENASPCFIQILCQPSQPDLKGFSIKSWTWQVMTIYSTRSVE